MLERNARRMAASGVWVLTLAALGGGCVVQPPPPPPPTTITVVNETQQFLMPQVFTSSDAATAAALYVPTNWRGGFSTRPTGFVGAGESVSVTVECDELASLGVDQPVYFDGVLLVRSTSADQVFLLRDADFACGATIRLIYFSEGGVFRVRTEVQ